MKKLIALILSLTFILTLVGCGKTTGSGEPIAGGADMSTVENDGVIQMEQTQPANTENKSSSLGIGQVYTLSQTEQMSVELVEWGKVDRFKGIVVDAGDNSVFPVDAKLSVVFEYDTEILLNDGTIKVFNPDEPNDIDTIGWKEGTIVTVEFVNYDKYMEGNHFYNQVYASYVEVKAAE